MKNSDIGNCELLNHNSIHARNQIIQITCILSIHIYLLSIVYIYIYECESDEVW